MAKNTGGGGRNSAGVPGRAERQTWGEETGPIMAPHVDISGREIGTTRLKSNSNVGGQLAFIQANREFGNWGSAYEGTERNNKGESIKMVGVVANGEQGAAFTEYGRGWTWKEAFDNARKNVRKLR